VTALALVGRTDKKKVFEIHGDKYIDLNLGLYDMLGGFERSSINVRLNVPSETGKPTLWVNGIKACEIVNGKVHCEVGGPMWRWIK
jgi:hypothetical protein